MFHSTADGISMMRMMRFSLCTIFALTALGAHAHGSVQPPTVWLNVIIHGTIGLRAQLNFSTFLHLLKDDIEGSTYQKVVTLIRNDAFFYKVQPIQQLGLHPVPSVTPKTHSAASLFAHTFESNYTPDPARKHLYYTFGWSGLLSHTERCKEAQVLYDALQTELQKIKKRYRTSAIHLRLICYSHGGSVALQLADSEKQQKNQLVVDELLLIGTPIQPETSVCVHSPIFKKIYNFYSRKDFIQKMDCFSFKKFFSGRKFKKECLCDKLVQIELKILMNKYPESRCYRIDRSPSHTELWFFGWTLNSYRHTFLTAPLPIAAFLPRFITTIEQCMPQTNHLLMTLCPDGTAHLRSKQGARRSCSNEWIKPTTLASLQQAVKQYAPQDHTVQEHKAHIHCAQKATDEGLKKLQEKYEKEYRRSPKHRRCLCWMGTDEFP